MSLDLYAVADNYLKQILPQGSGGADGPISVLLLDNATSTIISLVTTQSELLRHEIYLVERLENATKDRLRNLPCICFVRPANETLTQLCDEVSQPSYKGYTVVFNNLVSNPRLERLAESDDLEVVSKVLEVFQDYHTINRTLFSSIDISNPLTGEGWDPLSLDNSISSVVSLLLALKFRPSIRYEANSDMAGKLARAVNAQIKDNAKLFDRADKKDIAPLLLIMDRRNDPVTPLLFPWTYQAMIHEILGIHNNTVDMTHVPNVSKELSTVVLNETQDAFYRQSMYQNFGDLSQNLKTLIDSYRQKTKTNTSIATVKDMKFFLENYPEFKKTSLNVSKHMMLSSEIDKYINTNRMWEVSEFEQTMVSNADYSRHDRELRQLEDFLLDRQSEGSTELPTPLSALSKTRLLALYALKYERYQGNQTPKLLRQLSKLGNFPEEYTGFIKALLRYASYKKRLAADEGNIFDKVASSSSTLINGLTFGSHGDSANVYMQHVPRLQQVLMKLARGKLDDTHFPQLDGGSVIEAPSGDKVTPQEIVIFMVGGVTYEEARLVAELNESNGGLHCVIGGTHIPNTKEFIEGLIDASR